MEYKFDEITPESFTKYLLSMGIKKLGVCDMEVKLITLTKCTAKQAESITAELKELGLEYHYLEEEGDDHDYDWYNLISFAKMRGWNV